MIVAFGKLTGLIKELTGIVIDPEKKFIIESRLLPIARANGFDSVATMVHQLMGGANPALMTDVIDALTTNETFFFRDRAPFDLFSARILPYLMSARADQRAIKIWCTACSTGQEPYSLAMTIDQFAPRLTGWRMTLQASDISRKAIEAARNGIYNQFEVQRGMPANFLLRYFTREGEHWRIAEHLRSKVAFSNFNLLNDFGDRGPHDVVFCRNVLIYFDQSTRSDILARLSRVVRKDGFLILGSTEAVLGGEGGWTPVPSAPMLYVHRDGPHALEPAGCAERA
jgi:chemotaxis protein methyltransferase CheR